MLFSGHCQANKKEVLYHLGTYMMQSRSHSTDTWAPLNIGAHKTRGIARAAIICEAVFAPQDAKLKLVNGSYLLSPAIAGIFPGVEVHNGFTGESSG